MVLILIKLHWTLPVNLDLDMVSIMKYNSYEGTSGYDSTGCFRRPLITLSDCAGRGTAPPKYPICRQGLGCLTHVVLDCACSHNPVGMVAPKVAQRILELEFVRDGGDLGCGTRAHMGGTTGQVRDISTTYQDSVCVGWRGSPSGGILVSRPEKAAPELFAYQAL